MIIVTADLHLTDLPRDTNRWGLFPWLAKKAKKYNISHILLLGDITDSKDRHPATLVNRLCTSISSLPCKVIILRGNHDYLDPHNPFFQFLNNISNVTFISKPEYMDLGIDMLGENLFLPSTRTWEKDWADIDFKACHHFIFTHQSYDGCIAENGIRLEGIPPSVFKGVDAKIISGDIHVPQKVGKRIEYVGAPYRIKFGDTYTPRVMLIKNKDKIIDLHFPTKNKVLITLKSFNPLNVVDEFQGLNKGDQVKVRVKLKRSYYPDWSNIKSSIVRMARKYEVELHGIELVPYRIKQTKEDITERVNANNPKATIKAYAKQHNLKKSMLKAGLELLENTNE